MSARVLVNGFGAIGKRVAYAVKLQKDMKLVGISNRSINDNVINMLGKGGVLSNTDIFASIPEKLRDMQNRGFTVKGTLDEILGSGEVDVVIDATPDGIELEYKPVYNKYKIKQIYQGGAEEDIAPVSFTASVNYEKAFNKPAVRVVSCNTTSLTRTLNAVDNSFGIDEVIAVLIRRAVDPSNDKKGPVDAIVPVTEIPSHHGPDVRSVMPHLNIRTMAAKVPTTLTHVHFVTGKVNKQITTGQLKDVLENAGRTLLFKEKDGYTSTSAIMERFRDMDRPRGDMYEVAIWDETIKSEGNRIYWSHAVHSEAIAIPENIDAIRAITGIEADKKKSIEITNKSLGIAK